MWLGLSERGKSGEEARLDPQDLGHIFMVSVFFFRAMRRHQRVLSWKVL